MSFNPNFPVPTGLTKLLVADQVNGVTGTPTIGTIPGQPVAASLEIQSTTGSLLVPRMTGAQAEALFLIGNNVATPNTATGVAGMVIYVTLASGNVNGFNNTAFYFYSNGQWRRAAAATEIAGPGFSTFNAIATWGPDGMGDELQSTHLLLTTQSFGGGESFAVLAGDPLLDTNVSLVVLAHGAEAGFGIASDAIGVGTGILALFDNTGFPGQNPVGFRAPSTVTGGTIWALPPADGTPGQFLSTDGSSNLSWATGSGVAFPLDAPNGSAAAPSYSFTNMTNGGMYLNPGFGIDFATFGALQLEIAGVGAAVNYLQVAGSIAGSPLVIQAAAGSIDADVSIQLTPKGTGNVVLPTGQCVANTIGGSLNPSYSFVGDTGTGIYQSSPSFVSFSAAGVPQFQITGTAGSTSYLQVSGGVGAGVASTITAFGVGDVPIRVLPKGVGNFQVAGNTIPAAIALYGAGATPHSVGLSAPAVLSATTLWSLPAADGTGGQALTTNGIAALGWSPIPLQQVTTLSSAQLLALNTTSIEITPVPALSNMIIVDKIILEFIPNTTPYTTGGFSFTFPQTGNDVVNSIPATSLIDQAVKTVSYETAIDQTSGLALNTYISAILISSTGAFTGGDGTLKVTVLYNLIPVS